MKFATIEMALIHVMGVMTDFSIINLRYNAMILMNVKIVHMIAIWRVYAPMCRVNTMESL